MKRLFMMVLATLVPHAAIAADASPELVATVRKLDAVVFEAGYNNCDIRELATVVADDLEFYHDQGGPMFGAEAFLDSMRNGICRLDYRARRELVDMQVYPLFRNGELYGAVENGTHRFHAKYPGKAEYPTGIAKFSMLWLIRDGKWKMARVLSFDHVGLD